MTLQQSSSPTSLNIKGSEKTSRKSPPSTSAAHQRAVPYARESLGKVCAKLFIIIIILQNLSHFDILI